MTPDLTDIASLASQLVPAPRSPSSPSNGWITTDCHSHPAFTRCWRFELKSSTFAYEVLYPLNHLSWPLFLFWISGFKESEMGSGHLYLGSESYLVCVHFEDYSKFVSALILVSRHFPCGPLSGRLLEHSESDTVLATASRAGWYLTVRAKVQSSVFKRAALTSPPSLSSRSARCCWQT